MKYTYRYLVLMTLTGMLNYYKLLSRSFETSDDDRKKNVLVRQVLHFTQKLVLEQKVMATSYKIKN